MNTRVKPNLKIFAKNSFTPGPDTGGINALLTAHERFFVLGNCESSRTRVQASMAQESVVFAIASKRLELQHYA
jgi:hypothetical protein